MSENRARLAHLTAQPNPTFASLVIPVEELSYRLSRVWSPIGHLNAVANSAEMRQAYNECVPLLTAYSSELGQNTALYAGYAHVLRHEGESLDPAQRKLLENALRDFRLAGVDLPADRKARYREVMQRLAQLATKFSENVLDAARAYTRSVTDSAELAGLPANALDRAAADAREANQPGWLFKLDQPTYMTVMTSAESAQLRRDIYEAWVTRGSELGPSAGRFDNNAVIAEILPLRHELAQLLGFRNFADYALATRMAKSSKQVLGFLDDLARRCRPAARAGVFGSRGVCGPQARCLGPDVLRRAAAGEPIQGIAGSAAAVLSPAEGPVRAFRSDSAPVRHHGARAPGRERVASERALLRSPGCARDTSSRVSISIRTRVPKSAAARGWTNASLPSRCPREGRCRSRSWCATSPRRSAPRPRC